MTVKMNSSVRRKFLIRGSLITVVMAIVLGLSGCGGAASSVNPTGQGSAKALGNNQQGTGNVQLRVGDAPSDRVVAMDLTFSSIKLVSTSGTQTEMLAGPTPLEVTSLALTNTPLAVLNVNPDDYNQVMVSVSDAKVTYLDPVSNQPVEKQFSNPSSVSIALNPTVTISGQTSTVLSLDVDVAQTVNLDLVNDALSLNTPVITASAQPVGSPAAETPGTGLVEHVMGVVTAINGTYFTVMEGQTGQSLTFNSDGNTGFGVLTLADLNGAMVELQAVTDSSGSMLATVVENLGSNNAAAADGILTGYTNAGYMSLVAQNGTGSGMSDSLVGGNFSLNLDGSTSYSVNTDGIDMTNLPFVFDENQIMPGQRVEVSSLSALQPDPQGAAGFLDVSDIELEPQTISGTVNNYSGADQNGNGMFDLVLPADGSSYLTAINPGTTDIVVYQRSTTDMSGLSAGISQGQSLHVRGLLFYYNPSVDLGPNKASTTKMSKSNGSSTQPYFVLVATRITQ